MLPIAVNLCAHLTVFLSDKVQLYLFYCDNLQTAYLRILCKPVVVKMTRGTTRSTSDSDETEKLITKVCTNFITKIEAKIDAKLNKLDDKLSSLIDSLKDLETMTVKNNQSIKDMQMRMDSLEQNWKQNCLRICGLDAANDVDMAAGIASFVKEKLNIECTLKDLDFAYRVKNNKVNNSEVRSTLVVRFVSNILKSKVVAAKRKLKGTGVVIFEDLTRARYDLLVAARKKHGNNAWSAGGKIYFWDANKNCKMLISHPDNV